MLLVSTLHDMQFDVSNIPPYAPLFRVLTEDSGAAGAAIANLPLASYLMLRGDFDQALEVRMGCLRFCVEES